MICYPTTITLPDTGEILAFSHEDFDSHQGQVAVFHGQTGSRTEVAYPAKIAWMLFRP